MSHPTILADLFRKHGSDKADHGYATIYEKIPEPKRLLEIGVYKGASLRAWCEWWPKADVLGADTFERGKCPTDFSPMGRQAVVLADSRTDDFSKYYESDYGPNLIIDDGSHKPRDQAATFRNLWPLLAPGGYYFIEDVLPIDLLGEDALPPWFAKRKSNFSMAAFLEFANAIGGKGELKRHDFRAQSGKPDSVLLEIRKP